MNDPRLRVLLINWQDRLNPQAGGAEIHLHEIFGRLAARGHSLTLLCSGWKGARPTEEVDGIEVHRVGGRHTLALKAASYYKRELAGREFDLVVEDINKIPLYAPRWATSPVIALVPHLFGATAFREAAVPLAAAVWLAERALSRVYSRVPFQAISESTAEDLTRRGISRESITVIYPGIEHERFNADPSLQRFHDPTLAYVGRLKRYKGLETVIEATARVRESGTPVKLLIAGKGDHEGALRRYAAARAGGAVDFLGFIHEDEKVALLRRAWATVYPSPKEGWGITNVESAACSTPVIASDSPGLRESVRHGRSGLIVPHGDIEAWEGAIHTLVTDRGLRERLSAGAAAFASAFSWDRAAGETERHLFRSLGTATVEFGHRSP